MRGVAALALACACALAAFSVRAQQTDYSKVEIRTTDLGNHTWMLQGQGGNITVAVAGNSIVIVDTEYAPLHDKIKAAIAKVSSAPIRYAIDTHYHLDHTGGNAAFAAEGTIIVAQETVRKRLSAGARAGLTPATPAVSGKALPSKTYNSSMTLKFGGRTAVLRHAPHAHTDGDTYVWFPEADVLATGDTVVFQRFPNIDYLGGGSVDGMIAASDAYLKFVDDKTRIVPGHGPVGDKAALTQYRAMLVAAKERMTKLIADGKSEDEAVAANPCADFAQKFGASDAESTHFIRVAYHALKGG